MNVVRSDWDRNPNTNEIIWVYFEEKRVISSLELARGASESNWIQAATYRAPDERVISESAS